MSDTPVGERPATGGRVRQFNSDAERARAWRERQKERRNDAPGTAVATGLAEATLVSVLERLAEVVTANQASAGDLVSRAEEAIAALADPEAVAEEMATVRAETAREVAEANERIARANQAKAAADSAAREAENAANAAWEQAERLGTELEEAHTAHRDAEDNAARQAEALRLAQHDHEAAVAELERRHSEAMGERDDAHRQALEAQQAGYEQATADLLALHDETLARVTAEAMEVVRVAETRATEAEQGRARAEGAGAEIREELDRTRAELERSRGELAQLSDSVPGRLEAAENVVAENLAIRHRLELDAATANYQGQVGRLQAQLESATAQVASAERIAGVYQREAEILAQQLDRRPRTQRGIKPEASD